LANYIKKIAVIKELKSGFSADGGNLSGIVKAESYSGSLRVEASLINFAPLTDGKYLFGISDGVRCLLFDSPAQNFESDLNLTYGFAFIVCFCLNGATPIAGAACGEVAARATITLREQMLSHEKIAETKKGGAAYNDEAIAEVNYYEYETDKNSARLRKTKNEEEERLLRLENEAAAGSVKGEKVRAGGGEGKAGVNVSRETLDGLAGGNYYDKMRSEIADIINGHEREEEIEQVIAGSTFVKIYYGDGKYYVFGLLNVDGAPKYIYYGVPSANAESPPESLKGLATYVPCKGGGYWLMYQDALTGACVPVQSE